MVSVQTAAHRYLLASPAFQALITSEVIGTREADGYPWVFQGLDDEGRPFADPEHTGQVVVVVSSRENWAPGNPHNTARFPVVQFLIYADSMRTTDGTVLARDAVDKCTAVYDVIDALCHDPQGNKHHWDDLYVFSSIRSQDLTIRDVPGTQSLTVRGEVRYDLSI